MGSRRGPLSKAPLCAPYIPSSKNAQGDEKENFTAQALDLSLKYHFVTPLTSMVVTKPEDNEDQTSIADKPGDGGSGVRGGLNEETCV